MTMTFFHSPGSCSTGILMVLHEVGADFDTRVVDLRERQQLSPGYLAVNPKGKVPALTVSEGETLTEFQAIAYWLATSFPKAGLWPETSIAQAKTLAALDFIVGSVHMRGFTFVKVPQKFADDPAAQQVLREHGRQEVAKGFRILSEMLGNQEYLCGRFGIADAALFYVLDWGVAGGFELPENLSNCLARLRSRDSAKRATA